MAKPVPARFRVAALAVAAGLSLTAAPLPAVAETAPPPR